MEQTLSIDFSTKVLGDTEGHAHRSTGRAWLIKDRTMGLTTEAVESQ